MSRRRRSAHQRAARTRVTREKVLRRRSRRTASAATVAAIAVAAGGTLAGSVETAAAGPAAPRAACSNPANPSSNPSDFVDLDGTLFFMANEARGRGLWKSDGTEAGTVLVKKIDPDHADVDYGRDSASMTVVDGTLFFTADDGVHGPELWKSDGTRAGTVMVKDIWAGDEDDYYGYENGPSSLTDVGGTLFFTADDGVRGPELWKSDGTKAGTVMVKDITPSGEESDYGYDNGPQSLTALGGALFFTADDGLHGTELWRSDGTKAGTTLVKDIKLDEYDSEPSSLSTLGDTLFFTAEDGSHGRELWKSDGTGAGTVLVKDVRPGGRASEPSWLAGVGDTLFFTADDGVEGGELWKTDGTEAGTVRVKVIDPGTGNRYDDYIDGPVYLTGAAGTLFFWADDGAHGLELWTSDGSEAGTVLVKDIHPDTYDSAESPLTSVGSSVFFTAVDGAHGKELWTSDGTGAGTVLVKDIRPGVRSGISSYGSTPVTEVGDTVYFAADDGAHGDELWKSDDAGTVLVEDINPGGAFTVPSRGSHNTRNGTLSLRVRVDMAGRLAVDPVAKSRLKTSRKDVASAGGTTVTLVPTRAGMRTLKRTGTLKVKARFTFTPCGGDGTSVVRQYTLKLK